MNVALGVGGGIAAYKAAELTRALVKEGAQVFGPAEAFTPPQQANPGLAGDPGFKKVLARH